MGKSKTLMPSLQLVRVDHHFLQALKKHVEDLERAYHLHRGNGGEVLMVAGVEVMTGPTFSLDASPHNVQTLHTYISLEVKR